ncbi:hypothetical protein PHYBLDRAFT_76327 [Phycomyces blakesleeanus NRRL 1555(-)]|uniref:Uncharacterized protein n=1 Tax=Phycomyces blakesleeanus (strain ATCC 8743b / DSM 1359 / FGSC 10004 / NBRC 33097 / NRRL 1555) TaxID=763407 RepID=A0A162PYY4_PHYB8|nr:hypothetical protein PHYBLDRAFT_76327 [Phycomyces blakesleeanus NRRL 1555(-)]OAD77287.1 hypothetical protein PHYBLDRAFT_76327 [Phycomyces blakesleeanus NRRL 1555(-)]|eukprot:XP_018295327.1 hypothetical protein PHYBLDRAFT_76327 [Phycomyces blakesleeanus NRRL 1555(-)]
MLFTPKNHAEKNSWLQPESPATKVKNRLSLFLKRKSTDRPVSQATAALECPAFESTYSTSSTASFSSSASYRSSPPLTPCLAMESVPAEFSAPVEPLTLTPAWELKDMSLGFQVRHLLGTAFEETDQIIDETWTESRRELTNTLATPFPLQYN